MGTARSETAQQPDYPAEPAASAQSPQNIVVTSASSFQAGVPDRGSIGTIFCTGLNVSVSALTGYEQINFEVPQEAVFANDGSVAVTVAQNGNKVSAAAMAQNYPFLNSPGDFFTLPNSYTALSSMPPATP